MFLSAMTSALASALLLTAAPLTVTIEPLGFSVQNVNKEVRVTKVLPGSIAAQEGLEPGMRILSIERPMRSFARDPIHLLSQEDLRDALIPTWDEPLSIRIKTASEERYLRLRRTDPRPAQEFPDTPLTREQVNRLTRLERSRYSLWQAQHAGMHAPPMPEFELGQKQATAYVKADVLLTVMGGGSTPTHVYASATVLTPCEGALEKLVLRGAPAGGAPLQLRPDVRGMNASVHVDLPLWKPAAAIQACRAAAPSSVPSLESRVKAELHCQGAPVQKREFTATLRVFCDEPLPAGIRDARNVLSLAGTRRADDAPALVHQLEVGANGTLGLDARLDGIVPPPVEVSLVELDGKGNTARRHATKKVEPEMAELPFQVTLDTRTARTARLAAALRFADGSTRLSFPADVAIVTREEVAAQQQQAEEAFQRLIDFNRKLSQQWPSACDSLAEVTAWTQAQPEIEWAASSPGSSMTYQMKGSSGLNVLNCHRHHR
ncbi:PDZ domain-containing protein [Myxococcus xanthus]|uniref:PDZ domain-containing protein n=1 Tax=Myxococcus xanthus TaxID=34 RepID=UPI001129C503|nr:PDZ domain-containing protein [Myxococcus xanthus]